MNEISECGMRIAECGFWNADFGRRKTIEPRTLNPEP
jgi:hypothetical protein